MKQEDSENHEDELFPDLVYYPGIGLVTEYFSKRPPTAIAQEYQQPKQHQPLQWPDEPEPRIPKKQSTGKGAMSTATKGALIAAAIALVVGIATNRGIPDIMFGALFCWAPLGALIGAAWASKYKVSQKQIQKYKEQAHKDPTRYQP